ncbi:MAG: TIGR01244 family sulfur transferase [Phenylobacterium sp.]|nr:TIGR01244 family sulfur transferase [Phenylobacterium sp.]
MADFRRVTDDFTTAPQIALSDVAEAARLGYRTIINNRPDGEEPGQPTSAEVEAAARAAGLAYHHLPVRGGPTADQVEETLGVLAAAETPVLAFCRSGTRSIVTWSLCQATSGARSRDSLIALGRDAGYDLSGVLGA